MKTFAAGVIYLHPEPQPRLIQLSKRIWEAFPEFPPYEGTVRNPVPHLTVAKAEEERLNPSLNEVRSVLEALLPIAARADRISVMTTSTDGPWRVVTEFSLGPDGSN